MHKEATLHQADAIDHAIEEYRKMKARRYRLGRARDDIDNAIDFLDEFAGDAEADLSQRLREAGPRTIDGRVYAHAERDGCDVVEVRPA